MRKAERAKAETEKAFEQARATYETIVRKGKDDAATFVIESGLPMPR